MKIVLDSNIIIAAFISRGLCNEVFEICLSDHDIIISSVMLKEISAALLHKFDFPDDFVQELHSFLISASNVTRSAKVPKDYCRDADDLEVLGVALASKADAIVTGDQDLLVLKKFHSIPILSPRDFWSFLQKK